MLMVTVKASSGSTTVSPWSREADGLTGFICGKTERAAGQCAAEVSGIGRIGSAASNGPVHGGSVADGAGTGDAIGVGDRAAVAFGMVGKRDDREAGVFVEDGGAGRGAGEFGVGAGALEHDGEALVLFDLIVGGDFTVIWAVRLRRR